MTPVWARIIAILQFVGGLAGISSVFFEMIFRAPRWGDLFLVLVVIAVFAMSLVAGIQLWLNKRSGYGVSALVQLCQLPKIHIDSFGFMFSFGIDLSLLLVQTQGPAGHGFSFRIF